MYPSYSYRVQSVLPYTYAPVATGIYISLDRYIAHIKYVYGYYESRVLSTRSSLATLEPSTTTGLTSRLQNEMQAPGGDHRP